MAQDLEAELLGQRAQAQAPQEGGQGEARPLAGGIRSLVENPADDFITTLLEMTDQHGVLNEIFDEETIEDQADLVENVDFRQLLSEEELTLLVQKFEAMPPEAQQAMEAAFMEQAPELVQRMKAVQRFVHSRQGTPEQDIPEQI